MHGKSSFHELQMKFFFIFFSLIFEKQTVRFCRFYTKSGIRKSLEKVSQFTYSIYKFYFEHKKKKKLYFDTEFHLFIYLFKFYANKNPLIIECNAYINLSMRQRKFKLTQHILLKHYKFYIGTKRIMFAR